MPCQTGSHNGATQRACEFIKAHYTDHLSLKQLSRVACLSPFYFQRLFLENTGVSPHEYLIHYRIKKARELLAAGHSIAGVALEVGFVDRSHFTVLLCKSLERHRAVIFPWHGTIQGNGKWLSNHEREFRR
jgi:AraC-like DNA-binding protein